MGTRRIVHKQRVPFGTAVTGAETVLLPRSARIRHFDFQDGQPTLWFDFADGDDRTAAWRVQVVATGSVAEERLEYVATAFLDWTVWHLMAERQAVRRVGLDESEEAEREHA